MAVATCPRCGAPWDPDLAGACRYCRAHGGDAAGEAGLDPVALAVAIGGRLRAGAPGDPLQPLADDLGRCLGPAVEVRRSRRGSVDVVELTAGDWYLALRRGRRGLEGDAHHVVRGITLKREALSADEWVERAASALAQWSAKDGAARHALLGLG